MRDHTKLKVFELADRLTLSVYRHSATFPAVERYGLQSQVRRAAVSIAANIVEGCSFLWNGILAIYRSCVLLGARAALRN